MPPPNRLLRTDAGRGACRRRGRAAGSAGLAVDANPAHAQARRPRPASSDQRSRTVFSCAEMKRLAVSGGPRHRQLVRLPDVSHVDAAARRSALAPRNPSAARSRRARATSGDARDVEPRHGQRVSQVDAPTPSSRASRQRPACRAQTTRRHDAEPGRSRCRAPRARSAACIPPAPPNATSANRRGSWPRSSETTRIARSMLAFATRMTPSARSSTDSRSRRASDPAARPGTLDVETHAAAEKVAGIEPAEQQVRVGHRTSRADAIAARARESRRRCPARRAGRRRGRRARSIPPPAPTVWMSITGSRTGTSPIAVSAASGIAAVDQADVGRSASGIE